MSRVSENSSSASLKHALNRAKSRMEDLQLKGATLKNVTRPSDNPLSSLEGLALRSSKTDNNQFLRNAEHALLSLAVTESAIEALTEIVVKAKEIAIAQSSDLYNPEVRTAVANEVNQLHKQALSIANKRVGQRYIFGGYSTLAPPFNANGEYGGDTGKINVEITKDFFVPINLNGQEVFFGQQTSKPPRNDHPLQEFPELRPNDEQPQDNIRRDLASVEENDEASFKKKENLFGNIESLGIALENNDVELIQNLLERFDSDIDRLITLRTQIGSVHSSVETSKTVIDSDNLGKETRISQLLDADIAELFSDISKQQAILQTTYKSSQSMLNSRLIDFLR